MNTVKVSFDTTVRQMTKMSQWKNNSLKLLMLTMEVWSCSLLY